MAIKPREADQRAVKEVNIITVFEVLFIWFIIVLKIFFISEGKESLISRYIKPGVRGVKLTIMKNSIKKGKKDIIVNNAASLA